MRLVVLDYGRRSRQVVEDYDIALAKGMDLDHKASLWALNECESTKKFLEYIRIS